MSNKGNRRNRGQRFNKTINIDDVNKNETDINESSLVIQQFRAYAAELDEKHDRYERIVKISRDVTIESKRIIFLLHRISKTTEESVLSETKLKLSNVEQTLFKAIACELDGQDMYQYLRAYRAGLEEYIEAVTFYQYLHSGEMQDWTKIEKTLVFATPDKSTSAEITESTHSVSKPLHVLVTPHEHILGIADLTGELMRKCINNVTTGDIASCYQTCSFVRNIYKGFLQCTSNSHKEMNRKLNTLRQSLHKMENVCYTITVRGSEIPKHLLADVIDDCTDNDEKYLAY